MVFGGTTVMPTIFFYLMIGLSGVGVITIIKFLFRYYIEHYKNNLQRYEVE